MTIFINIVRYIKEEKREETEQGRRAEGKEGGTQVCQVVYSSKIKALSVH